MINNLKLIVPTIVWTFTIYIIIMVLVIVNGCGESTGVNKPIFLGIREERDGPVSDFCIKCDHPRGYHS